MLQSKLYIFCGIPFSGKSTLTRVIAGRKGFERIDLDEVKFELYGDDVKDRDLAQKDWDVIYHEMYRRIEQSLKAGRTVIHDTGNFTRYERDLVRKIGESLDIKATTVFVDTPVETARERLVNNRILKRRFNVTDKEFEEAVCEMERPDYTEPHLVFTNTDALDDRVIRYFG